ncbi:hypothetical protein MKZ38_006671 [Zalerion maritima]|uniref:Uncharacterized protein n=1 Tax=Zalerion maritima TaxID=339359 RepID=A0AAD5RXC5_9PEZI|nr:hypothetical protein MKZ38_006671 [Zalerion maritima]
MCKDQWMSAWLTCCDQAQNKLDDIMRHWKQAGREPAFDPSIYMESIGDEVATIMIHTARRLQRQEAIQVVRELSEAHSTNGTGIPEEFHEHTILKFKYSRRIPSKGDGTGSIEACTMHHFLEATAAPNGILYVQLLASAMSELDSLRAYQVPTGEAKIPSARTGI